MDTKQILNKKTEYWKKKLIDLSKRNNLVSYRFTKSKSLKIIQPNFKQIIEDLHNENPVLFLKKENKEPKERLWLSSETDSEEKNKEVEEDRKLTNLYRKTNENFKELGISTCFVSLGVLKYKESPNSEIYSQAPIFLYPVTLNRLSSTSKDKHRFEIVSGSEDVQVNPALIEKLSHDFDIDLPDFEDQSIEEYLGSIKKIISGMKDWKITEEIYVDIFSYQKYIMFKDLSEHSKLLQESNLIKAFVGDKNALQDEISESQRDEFEEDASEIDVLPADSTQKKAIELAKAGVTFVLQGPPGTGKSQTISNIIATLLEKKKKVLFVSQKMAALNVVHKRLEEVGLGRYCLNLHNYRGNKKEIIRQLNTELETSPRIKESVKRYSFADYINTQKDLNNFYDFLCKKHKPRTLSIYDIRGELAKLHSIEILDKDLNDSISSNEEKFTLLLSKIQNLDLIIEKIPRPMESIYFNFKSSKNTTLSRNKFKTLVDNTHQTSKEILEFIKEIKDKTSIEIKTLKQLDEFCDNHKTANKLRETPDFLVSDIFETYKKMISELNKNLDEINEFKSKILEKVKVNFVEEKTTSQEKIFKETSFLTRVFNKEYKTAKNELANFSKEKLSHNDWIKLFELKDDYKNALDKHKKIEVQNKKYVKELGDIYSTQNLEKLNMKSNEFFPIFKKAEELIKKPVKLLKFWLNEKHKEVTFDNLKEKMKEIDSYLTNSILNNTEKIEDLEEQIHEFIGNLSHIDDVLIFKEQYDSLNEEIKEFVKRYFNENVVSKLSLVFLKSYYLQLLEEVLKENNISSPKNKVEMFREKDFEVRDIKRFKIMDSIEQGQPSMNYHSYGTNGVSILKRENEKKRRLKPIRDLLEEIPDLIFSLKPCFMMSPLSVSQYINPNKIKFDVVIFDEASQIMPEDAVSCLMRAKQAIVVGDTQQLPPTNFFMSRQDDEIVEEEIEDLESFLSECSTKFRSKPLLWHYRSKNEHLIAFSNRFFYEHRLITFPNAKIKDDSGLDFVHVKTGVYDRGKSRKNRVEARETVKKYKELKKKFPNKSMGIIAFSIAQENAIREEFRVAGINIEESIDSHREDLFIKNLETVQGDERDIILISIGYGKDSSGKLSYHFGPLNREGGYKRLNVAITRSRFKTVVISSILPDDLDEDKINVDGVRYLKYYLDYSKNKDFNKFLQTTEGLDFDSSFEESVYEVLTKEGFSVSAQVGCSGYRVDLAIKHPKQPGVYLLGIECDGAQYHSSRFARDRDKVRQGILENLGWDIHRIWSDDWLNNREYEIKKIKEKVNSLLKSKKINLREELKFEKVEDVEDFKEISLKDRYEKYEVAEIPKSRTRIEFDGYGDMVWGGNKAKELMLSVLEVESPIEKELLYKRVLSSFGINKLGARIKRNFDDLINQMKREYSNIYVYGDTVSINKIEGVCPVRISKETQRPFILIPKEEIGGAIVDILKNTFGATKETLVADIAKGIFHNNRTGGKIKTKIDKTIKYLKKENIIEIKDEKIFLVK
jgi:very-short-patch-repair endonuclease